MSPIIRDAQLSALRKVQIRRFEAWVESHLQRHFPEACEAAGEAQVRGDIRHGIARAGAYGITAERQVCQYIDLMFVLGRDFDMDPSLPWAGEILREESGISERERIRLLYVRAMEHLGEADRKLPPEAEHG
ncbi:hypothetical protein HPC49_01260 [Pyxidicoccus fallax]|uniref:Uncharacterized protein n=1 Tax=Pyxidicoccus fallax TaxID=394095 RepID=A0A848L537_9BACT|nr:hypothetical protein [Pyxidicoccus fallax]NMO13587.1 hypothetical protein [Pyxidicoccus fallax]NPC76882.1 hypothetical protein [Pyxidicoccus fallax]